MSTLHEIAERDGWICWLCDAPVDPSVKPGRAYGPSIDHVRAKSRGGKRIGPSNERLAHGRCNSSRGSAEPKLLWPPELSAHDPAPLWPTLLRLQSRGGRELVAAFSSAELASQAASWLEGRATRAVGGTWQATSSAAAGAYVVYLAPAA